MSAVVDWFIRYTSAITAYVIIQKKRSCRETNTSFAASDGMVDLGVVVVFVGIGVVVVVVGIGVVVVVVDIVVIVVVIRLGVVVVVVVIVVVVVVVVHPGIPTTQQHNNKSYC